MEPASTYRIRAAQERAKASASNLPQRQAMLHRAAEAWDAIACQLEDTAEKATVNAAAKLTSHG
jgi:hypothetical protein